MQGIEHDHGHGGGTGLETAQHPQQVEPTAVGKRAIGKDQVERRGGGGVAQCFGVAMSQDGKAVAGLQRSGEERGRAGRTLGDQDAAGSGAVDIPIGNLLRHLAQWNGKPEATSLPRLAGDTDFAIHQRHQLPGDRQPEPGAAVAPGVRAIGLFEGVKHRSQLGGGDADSGVSHLPADPSAKGARAENNRPARGELHRVAQQVQQDLPQSQRVANNRRRDIRRQVTQQLQFFLRRAQGHGAKCAGRDLRDPARDLVETQLPGFNFREIENVVDDPEQRFRRPLSSRQVLPLLHRKVRFQRQLRHAQHAIHRRANLVTHVGQEFALQAGGVFGPLLGRTQFAIDTHQLRRLRRHLLLKPSAMQRQLLVATGDLLQHSIERQHQLADFIAPVVGHAEGVVFRLSHVAGQRGQVQNRLGNVGLKSQQHQPGDAERGQQNDAGNQEIGARPLHAAGEPGANCQGADTFILQPDRHTNTQLAAVPGGAVQGRGVAQSGQDSRVRRTGI